MSAQQPKLEQGAASLVISMRSGTLEVKHSDGAVLLTGDMLAGGWDALIETILSHTTNCNGPMAQHAKEV